MDADPLASMRCWAITLELGGLPVEVPPLPAADWWPVLISGDPSELLDIAVSTSQDGLDDLLLDGTISAEDLTSVYLDAIEAATGRPFQAAYVLATVAQTQWPMVNGRMAERGFRWDVMPIGAALDAIYAIVINGLDEDNRKKFLALLDKPMPGRARRKLEQDRDRVVSQFEAMAGPRPTGGVRSSGAPSGSARPKTQTQRLPPRLDAP